MHLFVVYQFCDGNNWFEDILLKLLRKVLSENRDFVIGTVLRHVHGNCIPNGLGGDSGLGENTR